jgi:hypothetical protein
LLEADTLLLLCPVRLTLITVRAAGVLDPGEIAADPEAAALAAALQQTICDNLGDACTDPSTVQIEGIQNGRRIR